MFLITRVPVFYAYVYLWTVLQVITGQNYDSTTEYKTFPKAQVSWNKAVEICRAEGMDLVKVDNLDVMYALSELFEKDSFLKQNNALFWIGLHTNATSIPQDTSQGGKSHFWQDCSGLGTPTYWSNNPNYADNCVSIESEKLVSTTQLWRSTQCTDQSAVLCEKRTGNCSQFRLFTSFHHTDAAPVQTHSFLGEDNIEGCQTRCLDTVNGGLKCLGFTYTQGNCSLYFSRSAAAIWSQITFKFLYIRFCFTMTFNGAVLLDVVYDNEVLPVLGCIPPISSGMTTTRATTSGEMSSSAGVPSFPILDIFSATTQVPASSGSLTDVTDTETEASTPGESSPINHTTEGPFNTETFTKTVEVSVNVSSLTHVTNLETQPSSLGISSTRSQFPITQTFSKTTEWPSSSGRLSAITSTETQPSPLGNYSTRSPSNSDMGVSTDSPVISTMVYDCYCDCYQPKLLTSEEKEIFINGILEKLTLEKANLSSNQRKYISADDPRPSSQGIGCVGVILMTFAFGGVVVLDFPFLLAEIKYRLFFK